MLVFFCFFEDFGLTKHGFETFLANALIILDHVIKELDRLLLQFLFSRTEINPAFDCLGLHGTVRLGVYQFLNDLAALFQLSSVPQEGSCTDEVFISCNFFAFVKLELVGVNCLLIDVSALLVIVDES